MPRQGKCTNYAGCLLAYRHEMLFVGDNEDFNCPECHQPLTPATNPAVASPKLIPALILGGILGLVLIGGIAVYSQAKRLTRDNTATPAITPAEQPAEPARRETVPQNFPADPAPSASARETGQEIKTSAPNLDVNNGETQRVKTEVLKRIDLMPNVSADNKDKLYMSVERARRMGKTMTIPFASGRTTLGAGDVEKLKTEIKSPQLQALMQDATCVFVILGYADKTGDEKTNLKISQERAASVLGSLRDKCGMANVMHAVGMGGSTLLNESGTEKNRAVEIWAVLP